MPISTQYAEEVGQALLQACPHVDSDPSAMEKIRVKLLEFDDKLGYPPPVERVLDWARDDEAALKDAADAAAVNDAARQHRRALENRSAEEDRLDAIQEFRAAHPLVERSPLAARADYTQAEIDKMSSDEYAIKVLGLPAPSMNLSQPLAKNEKNAHVEYRKKQIMRAPLTRDSRLNQTLRRMVLEGQIK